MRAGEGGRRERGEGRLAGRRDHQPAGAAARLHHMDAREGRPGASRRRPRCPAAPPTLVLGVQAAAAVDEVLDVLAVQVDHRQLGVGQVVASLFAVAM